MKAESIDVRGWFEAEIDRTTREADRALRETLCAPHYLYFRIGALAVAQDKPDERYELATPERVPGNKTVEGLAAWIRDRSSRLPMLPDEQTIRMKARKP